MNERNRLSFPQKKAKNDENQFNTSDENAFLEFYEDMNFQMNNSNSNEFFDGTNSNDFMNLNGNSQNVFSEDLQSTHQQGNLSEQENHNDSIKIAKLLNSSEENEEYDEFENDLNYFDQELKHNLGENQSYEFENGEWNNLNGNNFPNRLHSFDYQRNLQEYGNNENYPLPMEPIKNLSLANSIGSSTEMNIKNTEEEYEYDTDLKDLVNNAAISKKLKLSNLGLDKIPSTVWNLNDLVELDLSANQLKRIGKELATMKNLKLLALNHNSLSKLPNALWKLSSLRKLYLNNNNLKAIPNEIKNLENLRVLDFSCNNISGEVPGVIVNLTALVDLKLRKNQIT